MDLVSAQFEVWSRLNAQRITEFKQKRLHFLADLWSQSGFRTQQNAERKTDPKSELTHCICVCVVMCDSERADAAGTSGQRLKEGGSINKSLVTLGNVISTLGMIHFSCHF